MTLTNLTHREYQVAAWVPLGMNDVEIGRILRIEPRTVQNHLHHIYRKLEIDGPAHIKRVKLATLMVRKKRFTAECAEKSGEKII